MPQLSNGPEKATMEEGFVFALDRLGYEKLREEQEKVLRAFVGGRDVFAALPTGYAKSLCFTLLPHVLDHLKQRSGSIVFSPLTSLMMDQKEKFSQAGLETEFALTPIDYISTAMWRSTYGEATNVVYMPTQRLLTHYVIAFLKCLGYAYV